MKTAMLDDLQHYNPRRRLVKSRAYRNIKDYRSHDPANYYDCRPSPFAIDCSARGNTSNVNLKELRADVRVLMGIEFADCAHYLHEGAGGPPVDSPQRRTGVEHHPDLVLEAVFDNINEPLEEYDGTHFYKPVADRHLCWTRQRRRRKRPEAAGRIIYQHLVEEEGLPISMGQLFNLDESPRITGDVAEKYIDAGHLTLGLQVGYDAEIGTLHPLETCDLETTLRRRGYKVTRHPVTQTAKEQFIAAQRLLSDVAHPLPIQFKGFTTKILKMNETEDEDFIETLDDFGSSSFLYKAYVHTAQIGAFDVAEDYPLDLCDRPQEFGVLVKIEMQREMCSTKYSFKAEKDPQTVALTIPLLGKMVKVAGREKFALLHVLDPKDNTFKERRDAGAGH
ncbi:hypothetical protein PG984_011327 [Apiospora sp. TS-2023a]